MGVKFAPCATVFLCGKWTASSLDWFGATAMSWFIVVELGGGSATLSVGRVLNAIAVILFASAAGTVLKSVAPAKVLISACLVATGLTVISALLAGTTSRAILSDDLTIAIVLLICFGAGIMLAFREAAEQNFQSVLVSEAAQQRLESAWNAMYYIGRTTFGLGAGILLVAWGTAALLSFNAMGSLVLAGATGLATYLIRRSNGSEHSSDLPSVPVGEADEVPIQSAPGTVQVVRERSDLQLLLWLVFVLEGIGFTSWVLLPEIIAIEMKADGWSYGLVVGLSGVGGLAGTTIYLWVTRRDQSKGRWLFSAGLVLAPLGLLGAALSGNPLLLSLGYSVALIGWSWFIPPLKVYCRREPDRRPQIIAALTFVLLGVCRVAQVVIAVVLLKGFEFLPSSALLFSAVTSGGLVLATRLIVGASYRKLLKATFNGS